MASYQLTADNIRAVLNQRFDVKVLGIAPKQCNSALNVACRISSHNVVATGPAGVDAVVSLVSNRKPKSTFILLIARSTISK